MTKRKPLGVKTITLKIERGKEGLFYGTSPDLKGLLIAESERALVTFNAPQRIADLYHASGVDHVNIMKVGNETWIARPVKT